MRLTENQFPIKLHIQRHTNQQITICHHTDMFDVLRNIYGICNLNTAQKDRFDLTFILGIRQIMMLSNPSSSKRGVPC